MKSFACAGCHCRREVLSLLLRPNCLEVTLDEKCVLLRVAAVIGSSGGRVGCAALEALLGDTIIVAAGSVHVSFSPSSVFADPSFFAFCERGLQVKIKVLR